MADSSGGRMASSTTLAMRNWFKIPHAMAQTWRSESVILMQSWSWTLLSTVFQTFSSSTDARRASWVAANKISRCDFWMTECGVPIYGKNKKKSLKYFSHGLTWIQGHCTILDTSRMNQSKRTRCAAAIATPWGLHDDTMEGYWVWARNGNSQSMKWYFEGSSKWVRCSSVKVRRPRT